MTRIRNPDSCRRRSRGRYLSGVVSLGVGLVLAGCTWGLGSEAVHVTAAGEVPEGEWHPIVAEVIADGEVTNVELTATYETYVECMEAAGMVGAYAYDVDRMGISMPRSYGLPGEGPESDRSERVEANCYARTIGPVEPLYEDPLPWPQRSAARRESIFECLVQIDPAYSTVPNSDPLNFESPIYEEALQQGDLEVLECIDTAGVGWTEFRPTE